MYVLCIMMEIERDESSERQGQRSGLLEREKRGRERERESRGCISMYKGGEGEK